MESFKYHQSPKVWRQERWERKWGRDPGKAPVNNFSHHIICSRSHLCRYLVSCWCSSLTRSDSPRWQQFWAGHLPSNGARCLRMDPQDVPALQTPAEGLVPFGQCLVLKDNGSSPEMTAHSKSLLGEIFITNVQSQAESLNSERKSHKAVQSICLDKNNNSKCAHYYLLWRSIKMWIEIFS